MVVMQTFEQSLTELFTELQQLPDSRAPRMKVAVISMPRCGSKFFCDSMSSTGQFGRAREWANTFYLQAYANLIGVDRVKMGRYLQFVMKKTTSANGLFTLNFHVGQYIWWKKRGVDLLSLRFDRIYFVHRRDKIAQALSLVKAKYTNQWSSNIAPSRIVDAGEIGNSVILRALLELSREEEYFMENLAAQVCRSYYYEDFLQGDKCFREVLADCGVTLEDDFVFACDREIQRNDSDVARIAELKSYLGCDGDDSWRPASQQAG